MTWDLEDLQMMAKYDCPFGFKPPGLWPGPCRWTPLDKQSRTKKGSGVAFFDADVSVKLVEAQSL